MPQPASTATASELHLSSDGLTRPQVAVLAAIGTVASVVVAVLLLAGGGARRVALRSLAAQAETVHTAADSIAAASARISAPSRSPAVATT
jgi:hypothetical protein